ncbi:hypothetical protein BRARA_H00287 [Brassica rapa]|uniref:Uncharacterized protein n=1 Tax=Brassica campestris TaxID=3711 RepID=A0A397Y9B5_BRACM|nr:hypothetical protein BRARA_H00287 [Brassica rapa]
MFLFTSRSQKRIDLREEASALYCLRNTHSRHLFLSTDTQHQSLQFIVTVFNTHNF